MKQALAAILCAALAGCGALDPYETLPEPAGPGAVAAPRVAICYNPLATSRAEARAQAQPQCPAGTHAEPVDTSWIMQVCPVLLPGRATFACMPGR